MKLDTPRDIIDALKNSKSSKEKSEIVQQVSKEFISSDIQSGNSDINFNETTQDVKIIQVLLLGLGYLSPSQMSGQLDQTTMEAIKKFASKSNISVDVNKPITKEVINLFTTYQSSELELSTNIKKDSYTNPKYKGDKYNWPPKPTDIHSLNLVEKENLFGKIVWVKASGDYITVQNNFVKENIITIDLPQLSKIQNPPKLTKIRCHRLAAKPILALWQEWENLGLLSKIENWAGCFVPRVIRGTQSTLSPHAFGIAFDINTRSNGLGKMPPAIDEKGSVRELVPAALKLGFFWGGHFNRRKDGMHFELSRVDSQNMIA
jgi:hypothetical protein